MGGLTAAALLWGASAWASGPGALGVGLGGGLGVVGLSAKYHLHQTAIQVVAGSWGLDEGTPGLALGVDYLLEMPNIASSRVIDLSWNVGAGGTGALPESSPYVAAGLIAGLEVNLRRAPVDFVVEYRPEAAIIPGFWLELLNFGGHVRYYF